MVTNRTRIPFIQIFIGAIQHILINSCKFSIFIRHLQKCNVLDRRLATYTIYKHFLKMFLSIVLLKQSYTHSSIIYGYFYTIMAEMGGFTRDHMAYRPKISWVFVVFFFYFTEKTGLPLRNKH